MIRGLIVSALLLSAARADAAFDHAYADYGRLLTRVVHGARVDYQALKTDRGVLDAIVTSLDGPDTREEPSWPRTERLAFWINAYNVFTLRAIVDHYPIRGSWFSFAPKNSIRQIDGVWDRLTWRAAGRTVTLDQIEHEILRPVFKEPRVHFAINCASRSCPPLAADPYVAGRLDAQLDEAGRRHLGDPHGLQITGDTLSVSSILKWYGDDFVQQFASTVASTQPAGVRAVLGVVVRFGPPAAADLARTGRVRVAFSSYDWSLNDVDRAR